MNSSIFFVVRKYLAKIVTGDLTLRRGDQMLNLIIAPMLPRGKLRIYTYMDTFQNMLEKCVAFKLKMNFINSAASSFTKV